MKRIPSTSGDSLDLLLDTICNTFGGVLFISLLVVTLLKLSSTSAAVAPPSPEDQIRLKEHQILLRERQDRLTALAGTRALQEESIRNLVQPETRELLREQQRLKAMSEALAQERFERTDQITQMQVAINDTAERMRQLREALSAARSELTVLEKDLKEEIAARSHAARLPKQRRTAKLPAIFLLEEGCLYAYAKPGAWGLERNAQETEELTDLMGKYLVPRTGSGLRVATDGSSMDAIKARFGKFDRDQHFIDIVVWSDSFTEFATVRNALVDAGFEYRIIPIPVGDKIYLGASTDSPLVQ